MKLQHTRPSYDGQIANAIKSYKEVEGLRGQAPNALLSRNSRGTAVRPWPAVKHSKHARCGSLVVKCRLNIQKPKGLAGQTLIIEGLQQAALAFNDRLKQGVADPSWRLFWYAHSLSNAKPDAGGNNCRGR